MGLRTLVLGLLPACQAQLLGATLGVSMSSSPFFSPSFATSALPNIPLGFPVGFTQQNLFLPPAPKKHPKEAQPGIYIPYPSPIPKDPTASQSLTNMLTSQHDKKVDGKGDKAIKALFDQGSFRNFNIEIPQQNWAQLNVDPANEMELHCRLTTDYNTPQAKTWADYGVGCGYKGSVGSLRICLDENHHDNHVCRKLSLRVNSQAFELVTGNKTKTGPLIDGLADLFFAGMPVDLSMVSERTAYGLMNQLKMTASLATHAKLFLNGKYLGLYAFVQPVDEEFTKMHFAKDKRKGKGGLYKELWFNNLHFQTLSDAHAGGTKDDEPFLREILNAVTTTPLSGNAPAQFFDKYFDVDSLVDMVAFTAVIGSSDNWEERHNFFLYVRQDNQGKKVVWIPWDFDRLYDQGWETRGPMRGAAWWDIQGTATPTMCNMALQTPAQQAQAVGGSAAKIAWNTDIFAQFPPDINVPVSCDRFTQLMANGLGAKIRARTRDMAAKISVSQIRQQWAVWNAQIKTALDNDPSGPTYDFMLQQQDQLAQHFQTAMQNAVSQANQKDGIASPAVFASASSSPVSSTPASTGWTTISNSAIPAFSPSFAAPVKSFTPSFAPATSTFPAPSFPAATSFPAVSSFPAASFPSFPTATFGASILG